MKHRILYSLPARIAFLIGACAVAGVILLVQSILRIPAKSNRLPD